MNVVTEAILPNAWIYGKEDLGNIYGIQKAHGNRGIKDFKSYPFLSSVRHACYQRFLRMQVVAPLNWVDYQYDVVKKRIMDELEWREYGGKHYESVFTRFYQGSILPKKFGFDKRRAHLSTLICSGQITREQAAEVLKKPSLSPEQEVADKRFVLKKLGFSDSVFEAYLARAPRDHLEFGASKSVSGVTRWLRLLKPVIDRLFHKRHL